MKYPLDHLNKEVQFGRRGAVGTRTLDALQEDKELIDKSVADYLKARFTSLGITVNSVGVKDAIPPGDMKELPGKVVEAEKIGTISVYGGLDVMLNDLVSMKQ
jgi:regulator of protease activity HflC (stomatin/prohibitin superfamily)